LWWGASAPTATLCTAFLFPVPFSARVSSVNRYWVTFAKHRSPAASGPGGSVITALRKLGGKLDPAKMSGERRTTTRITDGGFAP
jgi:hypothetical protein